MTDVSESVKWGGRGTKRGYALMHKIEALLHMLLLATTVITPPAAACLAMTFMTKYPFYFDKRVLVISTVLVEFIVYPGYVYAYMQRMWQRSVKLLRRLPLFS